ASAGSEEETALLDAAREYERLMTPGGEHFADGDCVLLEVAFPPSEGGGYQRRELLLTPSGERPTTLEQSAALQRALDQLRETVRFVLISSGESIQSVLEGNFRQILHNVIREHLAEHFDRAEKSRQQYIHGLQDELLRPLREQLRTIVGSLFP